MISIASSLFFCVVVDDAGKKIAITKPAQRIVSLAPHLTEMLFAVGGSNQIMGISQESDYPEAAKSKTIVSSSNHLDVEKIISLHPDLIVMWSDNFGHEKKLFKKMGIPIYVSDPRYLEDIPRTLKNFGCLTGKNQIAQQAAVSFSKEVVRLHQAYIRKNPVNVFYQIGDYSLLTINKNNWINEAIKLCGGQNIAANNRFAVSEMDWESVIMANPAVVISDTTNKNWKQRWQKWPIISAVKNNQLYNINPNLIDRPGPRLVKGIRQMCEAIANRKAHYFNFD